jgi:ribosomal protein S18 acetylase RimI-like enzyme
MIIEYNENLSEDICKILGSEFDNYALKNGLECNYTPFNFIAKENNKVIGVITGNTLYKEIHISELIVVEGNRGNGIGSRLLMEVENHFKDKGFANINLTTFEFQAPKFYQKYGFEIEFVRENASNSKLTKYFLVKKLVDTIVEENKGEEEDD